LFLSGYSGAAVKVWLLRGAVVGCAVFLSTAGVAATNTAAEAGMSAGRLSDEALNIERSLISEQHGALATGHSDIAECLEDLRQAADIVSAPLQELSDLLVLQAAMRDRRDAAIVRVMLNSRSKAVLISVDAARKTAGLAAGGCSTNPLIQNRYAQVVDLLSRSSSAASGSAPEGVD
jgi:hypothetical protein